MKYVPLYRKYRPQMLEEIVGQSHIKNALTNAIALDKISHAYLFTGPRGTGKTSTARILAKSLNCKNGPTATPCGKCENCIDITNSIPMDVIEIDAASNRKVEDAQNILEKVMYAPLNSRYKIYIIDEVHMLSTTAFNALLKTLEEPPPNVIFILATTEVHKVLDTIKSRCQRFDFKRITTDDIVAHLKAIAKAEKINITDDALFTIAKNSAGGMRDSIALLDQLAVLGDVTTDDINNLLGRISFDVLAKLTDKILASSPSEAVEIVEEVYNSGSEPVLILSGLADYFKNLLIAKNCSEAIALELTQAAPAQLEVLKTQSTRAETHQIIFLIDKSTQYIKEIKAANNPRLWLEVALIDLANLADNTSLVQLQSRIAALEGGQPVQSAKPVMAPVVNVKPVPTQEEPVAAPPGNLWTQLLDNIQSLPTRTLLKQWAEPEEVSAQNVILAIKNEIYLNQFKEGAKRKMLEEAIEKTLPGAKLEVKLSGGSTPEPKPEPVPEPTPELAPEPTAEPVASHEPITHLPPPSDQVNMVVDLFDGKIIS